MLPANETKNWVWPNLEAEMSKSLAEQQLSTLSRDFTEVKTDLAAERQKNEDPSIAHNLNGGTGSCKKR